MQDYLELLREVLHSGERRIDRTGTGTLSIFAPQRLEFDLSPRGNYIGSNVYTDAFPLITTKKMFLRGVIEELLWFLRGDTSVFSLQQKDVHIWDGNYASHRQHIIDEYGEEHDPNGDLGPIYGKQWRCWQTMTRDKAGIVTRREVDQMAQLVESLTANPASRRHIVSAWNVAELDDMALPPCHCFFQCYVRQASTVPSDSSEGCDRVGVLDLFLYQRSADLFLGVPFNIASYALLLLILCENTGYTPGRLIMQFGDAHIYFNHVDQVKEQLSREPLPLPAMEIFRAPKFDMHHVSDFHLINYQHHPSIKAPMSV